MFKKVLIIGKVWPEPSSSAAGSRMIQLIEALHSISSELCFASAANDSEFMVNLQNLHVKKFHIQLNDSSLDVFLKELQADLVIFDRFTTEEQYGWRVAEICPDAIRVLDTEDLHCLRAARHAALKEKRQFVNSDLLSPIAKREIASMYRCDLSLIISEFELHLLQNYFKVDPSLLLLLPFMVNTLTTTTTSQWTPFSAREDFISIGNFLHEPNWDAVLYLKQSIWPLIRKQLPKAQIQVYGAYPSHKVFELHNVKEGFIIKGRTEDLKTVMSKARVCLAPLRFGAGLKGKFIDAMLYGTPSVTTSIGSESMHAELPWAGEIVETAEDLAQAACRLYTEPNVWEQAQKNGIPIINTLYSKTTYSEIFINRLSSLQKNLLPEREKNFTGAMLLQHTALSSRYMALWIEAKNKLKS